MIGGVRAPAEIEYVPPKPVAERLSTQVIAVGLIVI